jgi:hypothetical protein
MAPLSLWLRAIGCLLCKYPCSSFILFSNKAPKKARKKKKKSTDKGDKNLKKFI